MEFEWDGAKAAANMVNHGVSFEFAVTAFNDVFAVEWLDEREDYGEDRFLFLGMAEGSILLFVAYTERNGRMRIISARRAAQHEQDDYFRQNSH